MWYLRPYRQAVPIELARRAISPPRLRLRGTLFKALSRNRIPLSTVRRLDPERYTIAWIAPLEIEARAAICLFDEIHDGDFPVSRGQDYVFSAGTVCGHNVVLATLPPGHPYGTGSAAALAAQVKMAFPNLWFGLLVGVAAGLPDLSRSPPRDIRLGDVLVALPEGDSAGLIAYELGKAVGQRDIQLLHGGRVLAKTEAIVRSAIGKIKLKAPRDTDVLAPYYRNIKDVEHANGTFVDPGQEKDVLYELENPVYRPTRPDARRTRIWYGPIGSGEKLMRDATWRNQLRDEYGIIGLEMEAAGTMNTIPVGVIRGVCDYADRRKNKDWQPYASAMAASYAKAILQIITPRKVRVSMDTVPTPSKAIPFCRDPDFVPRGDLLDQIARRCAEPPSRVALVGLGGIGKSQLAIEFAYQFSEQKDMWVFWIHASTQARVDEGLRSIADAVQLIGRDQPGANIPQLLFQWLSNERNGRWLLILDSADNVDVFYAKGDVHSPEPLATYLPQSRNGTIIITTRDHDLAHRLTGHPRNVIPIGPMTEADALTLLERRLGPLSDVTAAKELIQTLDLVPLAISQAGAYIQAQGRRSSLTKYLTALQKNEWTKTWLLAHDAGDIRRYGAASNCILTTWHISFEHIRSKRPSAADLLSLMSFFSPQGILESLILPNPAMYATQADDLRVVESDGSNSNTDNIYDRINSTFHDDMAMLEAYCLVASTNEEGVFEMHGLVQLSTRKWLEAEGLQDKFKEQFVKRIASSFPTADYKNWPTCKTLFPHVEAATNYRPNDGDLWEWVVLLFNGASFANSQGRYKVAEQMIRKVRKICEETVGKEDMSTLASTTLFANVIRAQGQWEEAETLLVQVTKMYKTKLGPDHPNTLISMADLASTYMYQGRLDDAERLEVEVMDRSITKLGLDHSDTLASMANLALTYRNQGRWDDAERLEIDVMDRNMTMLGPDHPNTLTSMANLASTYMNQGRLDDAERLGVEVMDRRMTKLGPDHPNTLKSMNNLALTYTNQGRWDDAERLQEKEMERSMTTLGPDNPETLTSMANLASTYMNQGRLDDAERLEVEVMDRRMTKLGPDHPNTLISMANLASTYRNQGRWDDAERLEVEVMDGNITKLGPDHPNTLTSMANLASTYINQGRLNDAEKLEVEVMDRSMAKLGPDHPNTLRSMNNLAFTWKCLDRHTDALVLMRSCVAASKRTLGHNHPHTLSYIAALNKWSRQSSVEQDS